MERFSIGLCFEYTLYGNNFVSSHILGNEVGCGLGLIEERPSVGALVEL